MFQPKQEFDGFHVFVTFFCLGFSALLFGLCLKAWLGLSHLIDLQSTFEGMRWEWFVGTMVFSHFSKFFIAADLYLIRELIREFRLLSGRKTLTAQSK